MPDAKLVEARNGALNFNPPHLDESKGPPPPRQPLSFLDTHIDQQLVLKHVRRFESLPSDLSKTVDDYLIRCPDETFPPHAFNWYTEDYLRDAHKALDSSGVFRRFQSGISNYCSRIASGLTLHSTPGYVSSLFRWYPEPSVDVLREDDERPRYMTRHYALCTTSVIKNEGKGGEFVDQGDFDRALRLYEEQPIAAVGMFFSTNAKSVLSEMDALVDREDFPWLYNSRPSGVPPISTMSRPRDASETLWTLPDIPVNEEPILRLASRAQLGGDAIPMSYTHFRPKTIVVVAAPDRVPGAESYLQGAWNSAVITNSTVILFDCGNHIRIGIRHRQSQTLFLSDMIDVCSSDSPHYGKLILGMYISIVQDSLQRLSDKEEAKAELHTGDDSNIWDHRYHLSNVNISSQITTEDKMRKALQTTKAFISSRLALAIYVDIGEPYHSPNPSILLPLRASPSTQYDPRSYVILYLHEQMGHGATGEVFRGQILTEYFDAPTKYSPVIAKTATGFDRLHRLQHEYFMYSRLHARGVKGIPFVFGYFQDLSRNIGVLLLNDVGRPLRDLSTLSDQIKSNLKATLRSIHASDVLHGDIRRWNIMVDDFERVSIIDFDRAKLMPARDLYEQETDRLERLLSGEWQVDYEDMIGLEWVASEIEDTDTDDSEDAEDASTSSL